MALTIEELKEKLARVQQELAEVSAALDGIDTAMPPKPAEASCSDSLRFTGPEWSDPATIRALADEAFIKMGIDIAAPAPTAEEVQALMLREGIRPEDRVFTHALYEMREEG